MPAARPDGLDNVIAAGQTIRLTPVQARKVNLLVTSTCDQTGTATGANVTATINYAGRSSQDPRIPKVPDWVVGSTTSAGAPSAELQRVEPVMDYDLDNAGTKAASVKLYTVSITVDSRCPTTSVRLPHYGTTFTCANAALHVFSIGTS